MHRAVPWAFLAIVVLTLSAVTAWPRGKKASAPAPSPPIIQQGTNGSLTLAWRSKPPAGARFHKSVSPDQFKCVLDKKLTAKTIKDFATEIGGVWGDACGRNRGIFVVTPPDGQTYDCGKLPKSWGVPNVGSILTADGATAYKAFGNYISAVYNTSIVKGITACDFNGLAYLECGREEPWRTAPWYPRLKAPIRSVNIGGLFVLERWILPGFTDWGGADNVIDQHSYSLHCEKHKNCNDIKTHWKTWYTLKDFQLMASYNLNTIRLPVGWWYFAKLAGLDATPYVVPDEDILDPHHPITDVLRWANQAGLHIILDLHGCPGSQNNLDNSGVTDPETPVDQWGETWLYNPSYIEQSVTVLDAIARYVKHLNDQLNIDNVILIQVANEPWVFLDMGMVRDFYIMAIGAIRSVLPDMPILLHDSFHGDEWKALLKYFPYDDIFMDTHLYHGFNVADVASDTYQADKLKMFVHEKMSCAMTSMLRFETCSAAPTMVGEWSLAIDNCMDYIDSKFADYGQCDRIAWRNIDPWWKDHIKSFAHRQIDVYERELGWSFWTWKLDQHAETTSESAGLWSFRLAVEKGYIDPTEYESDSCMHDPKSDWQGNTPPAGAGPAVTPSSPALLVSKQQGVPSSPQAEAVILPAPQPDEPVADELIAEEPTRTEGPATARLHHAPPVTLLVLTALVTLMGVVSLGVRLGTSRTGEQGPLTGGSDEDDRSPFMRRVLAGRRRVAMTLPRVVLGGGPFLSGYQTVAEEQQQGGAAQAGSSIQV